ncbi:MAG: metallophosphoesterase [Candidatus Bathyarchaeota archaeon]|nr:metallophosphoesterase [Candidatus Bathyarchaeota archaeon]
MNKKRLSLIVLLAFAVSTLVAIPFAQSYTPQKIAEYMSSPLPTAPEPVLIGGDFPVMVKDLSTDLAGGVASAWSGEISSIYGVYTIPLVNGTFDGEKWLLYFNVPDNVHAGLYNLTLAQGSMTVHQSNSIWVLENYPDTITFSQITDIHEPIGELLYPQFIMQSNFMNPDFVLATGDIVQTESNARAWAYTQYANIQYEVPIYMLPGNHDYSGYGGKGYAMYGGKLNYTLVLGDFVVIAADSGENGYFNPEQVIWIEQQLQKYPDKVKILGFHHAILSSEFEEDMGSTTGGYIEVDWDDIDSLAETMYFTWLGEDGLPLDVTKEVFRLVHEYDVRIILNGHVHRDMIYVVDNQHYFVTTCTTGGGLPETQRYGSRLITVEGDGTVTLDPYAVADIDNPPNNLPTGYVSYTYSSANDFTGTAVSAKVQNDLEIPIIDGRLIFKVSDSKPLGDYVFVGEQPTRVETTTTSEGYVFEAYFDVPAQTGFEVTLKAEDDTTEPSLGVELAAPYQMENPTTVTLSVSDYGWGLKTIDVSYSLNDGSTWIPVEASIEPILVGDLFKDNFGGYDVTFEVPALFEGESILVKAEATDYAGNEASFQSTDLTLGTPTEYTLSVDSTPITVDINVDGISMAAPHMATLEEGEYTVSAPETITVDGDTYELMEWSTGETGTEITITLSEDTSITVTYEMQETTEPDTEPDTEPETEPDTGGGIPFPAAYMLIGVAAATLLISLRKPRGF